MRLTLRWIQYLLVLALGVLLVVVAVDDTFGRRLLTWLLEEVMTEHPGRFALAGIGVGILTVQALLVVRWLSLRRYAREIGYANEFGKVSVSLVAIEEALTRAIENEPGVRRVALRVYEDRVKRTVIIEPVLTLWEDHNVTAINHRCQEILRTRFAELMPERTQVQVNLSLHRLNQRPAEGRSRGSRGKTERGTTERGATEYGATERGGSERSATGSGTETQVMVDEGGSGLAHGTSPLPLASPQPAPPASPSSRLAAAVAAMSQQREGQEVLPRAHDDEDELDYDNLYAGPTYPVDRDDDDTASHPRGG